MLSHVVSIVTGGASGLGAATAACLARNGAKVMVADLGSQKECFLRLASQIGAETALSHTESLRSSTSASQLGLDKPIISFAETDVTNPNDVSLALDKVEEHFGEPVNAAINCAGIAVARKTLSKKRKKKGDAANDDHLQYLSHPIEDFSECLRINTVGSFNVARMAAERMASRDPVGDDSHRGCIINTASIAAYEGQIGQVAYAASKGAIVGMTLPMARDLAPLGIRVMTIAPGLFETPLLDGLPEQVKAELGKTVPLGRLGKPEEFGQLVMSILMNPMLSGEVIRLDGALRMQP